MCQAIPRKVLQVASGRVEVLYDGEPRWLVAQDIPGLVPGEYAVVYAGVVLDRMSAEEAEEVLRFYSELDEMLEAAQ